MLTEIKEILFALYTVAISFMDTPFFSFSPSPFCGTNYVQVMRHEHQMLLPCACPTRCAAGGKKLMPGVHFNYALFKPCALTSRTKRHSFLGAPFFTTSKTILQCGFCFSCCHLNSWAALLSHLQTTSILIGRLDLDTSINFTSKEVIGTWFLSCLTQD